MKVNNPSVQPTTVGSALNQNVENNGKEKSGIGAKDALGSLGSASKVEVSEQAQRLQKAKEIAKNDSVDEAKVARLQALIDAGKYKTDAEAIADRLVDEHLLMTE
jgi:flagellar biosynthesis anti-sigma factor FlgM